MKIAFYSGSFVLLVMIAVVIVARMEPAPPSVARVSLWIDTVRRGEMLRQVRGTGSLVPRDIRWISSQAAGRVERVLVQPGASVSGDTVLVEMSNADVVQQAEESRLALEVAEADLIDTKLRLKGQELDQRAAVGLAHSEFESARLRTEAEGELVADGIVAAIDFRRSELMVEQLRLKLEIEEERLGQFAAVLEAQVSAARARVEQARSALERQLRQIEALGVVAAVDGVLQELLVEAGQRVEVGENIARVARPDDLQAELRVPETQAREVQVGQRAQVDTRNGIIDGVVSRLAPAVRDGAVQVEIELTGPLPHGARPDLSVEGTIRIERLEDVVFVGRPAHTQAGSTTTLFKLDASGEYAVRVPVEIGRASANGVEIVGGLDPGDRVILSDTSGLADYVRIQLD